MNNSGIQPLFLVLRIKRQILRYCDLVTMSTEGSECIYAILNINSRIFCLKTNLINNFNI